VGGALRDARLGLPFTDVDWIVPDPEGAARDLAERTGASCFAMDEGRAHWRVVTEDRTIDLVPLAGSLEANVKGRDFTVNAMAMGPDGLFDPLGGEAHLRDGLLVACSPSALREDPLRGLRGVRLAATHGFAWEAETRRLALRAVAAIASGAVPPPATERVRDEVLAILFAERPGDALLDAHALGWLDLVMPELVAGDGVTQGGLHHLDVLHHELEALQRLATGFPDADAALRLATLLHDVGKPSTRARGALGRITFRGHAEVGAELTRQTLRRLRFDGETVQRASALVRWHMLPLPRGERATRRFVHRRRELLPDLLSLMLADREAARGRLASEGARRAYREGVGRVLAVLAEQPAAPPLLNGVEVMALLDLEPGPRVGRALGFVEEARAVGDVSTVEEARAALQAFAVQQGWVDASS